MRKNTKIKVKPVKILRGYLFRCPNCGKEKKTFNRIVKCTYCLKSFYIEDEGER